MISILETSYSFFTFQNSEYNISQSYLDVGHKEQLDYSLVFNLHSENKKCLFLFSEDRMWIQMAKGVNYKHSYVAWLTDRCCQSAWLVDHSSVTFNGATVSFRIKKKASWHIHYSVVNEYIRNVMVRWGNCHTENRLK